MIDFVGKRFWFFLVSGLVILAGIILLVTVGLQPGVDFSAGSSATVRVETKTEQARFREVMSKLGYPTAVVQVTGSNDFFVRLPELTTTEKETLVAGLNKELGKITVLDYYSVSPTVASDTVRDTGIALVVAAVCILLYIAWAFRKMKKSFRWGTCALIPLLHDVFIVVTVFAILGWVLGIEVDALFITAVLSVVGYSINNTIVVFDRIRDNMNQTGAKADYASVVNTSIVQTIARSAGTSLTTLFAIVAIFLFGGSTVHNFMLALLVGVVAGTYSASCIAPQLLVVWEKKDWGLPWRRMAVAAKQ
jgi:preprotein translocase subunit SecF